MPKLTERSCPYVLENTKVHKSPPLNPILCQMDSANTLSPAFKINTEFYNYHFHRTRKCQGYVFNFLGLLNALTKEAPQKRRKTSQDYTTQHLIRQSSSYSQPWEPERARKLLSFLLLNFHFFKRDDKNSTWTWELWLPVLRNGWITEEDLR